MERLLADAGKISGQTYDISNLADVYEAIHVIQKEMGLTGTSAKEAETTLSGSFNSMKAAAMNFMGALTLGQDVTSSLQGLITTGTTFLFKNLVPALGNIITSLPSALGTFVAQGIPAILEYGKQMLASMAKGMAGSGDVIKNAFKSALDLSKLINTESGGIVQAGMDMLLNLAKGIAEAIPTIIETVPKIITNLANTINSNGPSILATGVKIVITLAKGLIKAIPTLIKAIPQMVKALFAVWQAVNWANLGKALISKVAGAIKAGIGRVGSAISSIVSKIKSALSFSGLASKVGETFSKIKSKITSPITSAKEKLSGIINKIKNLFPFNLGKILKLKLPHISVSAGKAPWGIGGKGKKPTFSVKWNAEGGIATDPTILQGVGEAGPEAIMPLNTFWQKMDKIAEAVTTSNNGGGSLTVVLNLDGSTIAQSTIDYINDQTIIFGTNPLTV